jgi:small subunit ribosomal protein S6
MAYYESVFIARQDISSSNVEELAGQLRQLVQDNGGQVTKTEQWGLKNLAYRIRKNRKGHYVMFNLDAPPAAVHELERTMRYNEDIIRYLTVRVEKLDENPSVQMERKDKKETGGRGERRGGGRGGRRRE